MSSVTGDWLPPNTRDDARPFAVYGDALDLSDEFEARLYVLAAVPGNDGAAQTLVFEQTNDAPAAAARLVEVLNGRADPLDRFGKPDVERGRVMRDHFATAKSQLGKKAALMFAVKYGKKVRRSVKRPDFPTADMLSAVGSTIVMGPPNALR